jgi:hypothetical protein
MALEKAIKGYLHRRWNGLSHLTYVRLEATAPEFLSNLASMCSCDDWHADDDD